MAVWFLLSVAVVCSVYDKSIMPALVVLAPVAAIAILAVIMERDIRKAFIEIIDNHIAVTDFYLDLKAEKTFSVSEIGTAEITIGYSMRVVVTGIAMPGVLTSFSGIRTAGICLRSYVFPKQGNI